MWPGEGVIQDVGLWPGEGVIQDVGCNQESDVVDPDPDPGRIRNFVGLEDPDLEKSSNSNDYCKSWDPRNANDRKHIDQQLSKPQQQRQQEHYGTLATEEI